MCDQDLTHSLDTLKSFSVKSVPQVVIWDACDTWHALNTVTSIHSIQKSTRNSQKLGNNLASKTMLDSGWQKIQESKQKEIELISKIVWRKRRCSDKDVDCCSMWRNIKAVVEEHLSSENVARYLASYILLVDMIMMMKWLCTYWPTINKRTSLNKPTSKWELFKK